MTMMRGGTASQGTPIGILLADTVTPRAVGDIGNGFTFAFPVRFYTVRGVKSDCAAAGSEEDICRRCIQGARELAAEGCQAVTTSCSAFAPYQEQVAAAVKIPVFLSSLLQAPFIAQIIQTDRKVGILTMDVADLDLEHWLGHGLERTRVVLRDMDPDGTVRRAFSGREDCYDYEMVEAEISKEARQLCTEHPEVGAIVCENSGFAPFAPAIARETGLPVFDIVTLTGLVASGLLRGMTSSFRNRLNGGDVGTPHPWGRERASRSGTQEVER